MKYVPILSLCLRASQNRARFKLIIQIPLQIRLPGKTGVETNHLLKNNPTALECSHCSVLAQVCTDFRVIWFVSPLCEPCQLGTNGFLRLWHEIQHHRNFPTLHSMCYVENTIKKQKSSINSIGSPVKQLPAQESLLSWCLSHSVSLFSRLSWFPEGSGWARGSLARWF